MVGRWRLFALILEKSQFVGPEPKVFVGKMLITLAQILVEDPKKMFLFT